MIIPLKTEKELDKIDKIQQLLSLRKKILSELEIEVDTAN